jgi:mannose-6-phosphate isomerase-like protein (cupin superfamily)
MDVIDVSARTLEGLPELDLRSATVREEGRPEGGELARFNDCVIGISRFVGQPPWERHPNSDEMLQVVAGHSDLTILSENGPVTLPLDPGSVAIVPRGLWHRNHGVPSVTMMYVTPAEGSEHSWDEPHPGS